MVQYYCAGVSGISQAQGLYRDTMSEVDMVSDPFGSYDTLDLCSHIDLDTTSCFLIATLVVTTSAGLPPDFYVGIVLFQN